MGAGLIIVKFSDVMQGRSFRYRKSFWTKEGPFCYSGGKRFLYATLDTRRYTMRPLELVATKPENCINYHS